MKLRGPNTEAFKILFIPSDVTGVAYWRMKVWADALGRLPGVSTSLQLYSLGDQQGNPWQQEIMNNEGMRHSLVRQCSMADVIVFQKIHFRQSMELVRAIKNGLKKPVVMEIDDDILNLPPDNIASIAYRPGSDYEQHALGQMAISDAMVTTTGTLKRLYSKYNDNIHIVPNSLNLREWSKTPARHQGIRIGWVGSANHTGDLELVKGAIRRVLDKYPDVKFYCVHGVPEFFKDQPGIVPVVDWATIDVYPSWVASFGFDIGIAPLHDNYFNRGKSNLRYLEYASMGIPTAASNVGHFKETLNHGHSAFLCTTEDEWVESLSKLVEDEGLRKKMGEAARKDVVTRWNADRNAKDYMRFLKTVVRKGPAVEPDPLPLEAEAFNEPLILAD